MTRWPAISTAFRTATGAGADITASPDERSARRRRCWSCWPTGHPYRPSPEPPTSNMYFGRCGVILVALAACIAVVIGCAGRHETLSQSVDRAVTAGTRALVT